MGSATKILSLTLPHFDNHLLVSDPILMGDDAMPHHARAVINLLRNNAIDNFSCSALSLDLNPIEHLWDQLGRHVRERHPPGTHSGAPRKEDQVSDQQYEEMRQRCHQCE